MDRVDTQSVLVYMRKAITLQPGRYRARVRHKKISSKNTQPLWMCAQFGDSSSNCVTTPVTSIHVGPWQWTTPLEFTVKSESSIVFVFGNLDFMTFKSDWLFDSFELTLHAYDGDDASDAFGFSVSGAGDVNADGYSDVVVGAYRDDNNGADSGSVRVLSGKDGKVLYVFYGDSAGDQLGWSVSGAGDINGDGFADVIAGAPYDDNNSKTLSGSARVFSGKDGTILYTFDGDLPGDQLGISVSGAGDVNGDGFADVIIGANGDDDNGSMSGSARVLSGKNGKLLLPIFSGDHTGDQLGWSVSGAGDVNGDGIPDLIAGAVGADPKGTDSGAARVLSGKDGSVLYDFYGDNAGDQFGRSVSGAGDVNHDGFADLVVGAMYDDNRGTSSGSVRVLSGKDGTILYTFDGDNAGDQLGISVSGAGDVNGDGYADIIAGANADDNNGTTSGSARLYSGKDGNILGTFDGNASNAQFGASVSGAGDVDGDGFADVIAGGPYAGSGEARIIVWRSVVHPAAYTLSGDSSLDAFGYAVSAAGDVNGDGSVDLIIGSPGDDTTGSASVVSGKDGTLLHELAGGSFGDLFGQAVSGAGDVNGDGFVDLVIGAPADDDGGEDSGTATLVSGKDYKVLKMFLGDSAGDRFGNAVSAAGDMNGDGFPDLIIGAPNDDNRGADSGSARAVSGKDYSVLRTFDGDSPGDQLGYSVSDAGDVNRDGYADVIVGAPYDDNSGADSGNARVLSGRYYTVLLSINGDSASDHLGWSVSGAGDVNGDGYADVIVGAPGDGVGGAAWVYSGKGPLLYKLYGDSAGDGFGSSVAGAGDVDGDGFADLIVGAPDDDPNGTSSGSAWIYSGRHGRLLYRITGDNAGDRFGFAVSGTGDVNCDGLDDLIAGAYQDDNNGLDSGSARVFTSHRFKNPGQATVYGLPCADSRGYLPRVGLIDAPALGQTSTLTLHSAPVVAPAVVLLGARADVPFGSCRLLVFPINGMVATPTGPVITRMPLPIPDQSALLGVHVSAQWAILDTTTTSFVFSDAVDLRIGRVFPM